MAHDYTKLDSAILANVADGPVDFTALSISVSGLSDALAASDQTPGWRIVDRRLQALRKAGRIRYRRNPHGWVLCDVPAVG